MTNFTISLAELPIRISAIHPSSKKFCHNYLTQEEPEVFIAIEQEDIEAEQEKSIRAAHAENREVIYYSDAYLETLAIYRKIAEKLSRKNIILFHGAAIAVDGEVYLFMAKSGTGKTTHVRNWLKYFGDRACIVNGDKPLIKVTNESVYVCGTPWCGKENYGDNIILPLKAMCILRRDETNHIERVKAQEHFPELFSQIFRPSNKINCISILDSLNLILNHIPLFLLGCNMDPNSAIVAYNGMH